MELEQPVEESAQLVVALARPESAWRFALLTTLTSVIGGLLGYCIGYFIFDSVEPPYEAGNTSFIVSFGETILPDGTVACESIMSLADVPEELLASTNPALLNWKVD